MSLLISYRMNILSIILAITTEYVPYQFSLLSLQIILPGFFEQSHTRIWLKGIIRIWCNVVSWFLGIKSYLLGSEPRPNDDDNVRQQPEPGAGLAVSFL